MRPCTMYEMNKFFQGPGRIDHAKILFPRFRHNTGLKQYISFFTPCAAKSMAVERSNNPLVWIDCEMTGLNHLNDRILSVSCFITSAQLDLLEPVGYHAVISTSKVVLDSMDEWCTETHTRTGLIAECLASSLTADEAASQLFAYVVKHVPSPQTALLAGNSVHVDKLFLMQKPWAPIVEWLHYRILDVSAIKEGARRWCRPQILAQAPVKKGVHSAKDDVLESIEEARWYMDLFAQIE